MQGVKCIPAILLFIYTFLASLCNIIIILAPYSYLYVLEQKNISLLFDHSNINSLHCCMNIIIIMVGAQCVNSTINGCQASIITMYWTMYNVLGSSIIQWLRHAFLCSSYVVDQQLFFELKLFIAKTLLFIPLKFHTLTYKLSNNSVLTPCTVIVLLWL